MSSFLQLYGENRRSILHTGYRFSTRGSAVLHTGYWFSTRGTHIDFTFSVRNDGSLLPTSVIQGPGHNFATEFPSVFLEDSQVITGERVTRARQYPSIQLPSAPVLQSAGGSAIPLTYDDVELLNQATSTILRRRGQAQPPVPAPQSQPVPVPTSTSPSTLSIPPLEPGSKECPVCLKKFREYGKCKIHYDTKHARHPLHFCSKCNKALGSKEALANHNLHFHKATSYVCNICQFSTSRKVSITKHMSTHQRWKDHPNWRCQHCIQVFHNLDGLHQHLKVCRHNPNKELQQYMCHNPGCGSTFTQLKRCNFHEVHKCHLLKKNVGRGQRQ